MRKKIIQITDSTQKQQMLLKFSTTIDEQAFHQLTHSQYSHNSALSMVNDWNAFVSYVRSKGVTVLPASSTVTRQYVDKISAEKRYASVKRSIVTVAVVHKFFGFKDPTASPQVQLQLRSLRLSDSAKPNSAQYLTKEHLLTLESQWDTAQPKVLRDLAIMNLMFECALKRGQLCRLVVGDICATLSDTHSYTVTLEGITYQLSDTCSELMDKWLKLIPKEVDTPLFRSIDRHGNIGAEALDVSSIYRLFRHASNTLGLKVHLSGQSPRAGAAQELSQQGYSLKSIQEFGRWQSAAMPALYIGNQHVADNARLKYKTIKPWIK